MQNFYPTEKKKIQKFKNMFWNVVHVFWQIAEKKLSAIDRSYFILEKKIFEKETYMLNINIMLIWYFMSLMREVQTWLCWLLQWYIYDMENISPCIIFETDEVLCIWIFILPETLIHSGYLYYLIKGTYVVLSNLFCQVRNLDLENMPVFH